MKKQTKFEEWLSLRNIDDFEWEKIVVDEDKWTKIIKEWNLYNE